MDGTMGRRNQTRHMIDLQSAGSNTAIQAAHSDSLLGGASTPVLFSSRCRVRQVVTCPGQLLLSSPVSLGMIEQKAWGHTFPR